MAASDDLSFFCVLSEVIREQLAILHTVQEVKCFAVTNDLTSDANVQTRLNEIRKFEVSPGSVLALRYQLNKYQLTLTIIALRRPEIRIFKYIYIYIYSLFPPQGMIQIWWRLHE
jgi:hypothetical protein